MSFEHRAAHLGLKIAKAEKQLESEVAERTEFEAREWQRILVRWPQVRDIEANFRICKLGCEPLDVTLDNIALLLEDESFVRQLSLAQPEAIKAELIDQIVEPMDIDDGGFSVKNRRKTLSFWTLEKLREELRRVEAVTELQFKSTSQLREIVKQGRPPVGRPELPGKILFQGEMVKLDAIRIKSLDREDLKRIIRLYGADQVNSRLRGE